MAEPDDRAAHAPGAARRSTRRVRSTAPTRCSLVGHRRARARSSRSTAATARRRPTATSAARSGGSIGASTATSACCIRRSATGRRARGEFERVTWDEALDLIAAKMREARDALRRRVGAALLLRRLERPAHERPRGRAVLPPLRRVAARAHAVRRADRRGRHGDVRQDGRRRLSPTTRHARLIVIWGCNPSASGIHLVSHIKQRAEERRAARRDRSAPDAARAHRPICTCRSAPAPTCPWRSRSSASSSRAAAPTRRFSPRTRPAPTSCARAADAVDDRPRRRRSRRRRRRPRDARRVVRHDVARRDSLRLGPGAQPQRRRRRRWRSWRCRPSAASSACAAAATR